MLGLCPLAGALHVTSRTTRALPVPADCSSPCQTARSHIAFLWLLPTPALLRVSDSASVCQLQQPGPVDGMLPLGSKAHQVLPCKSQSPHMFAGALFGWQAGAHHLKPLIMPVPVTCSSLDQPAGWCPWARRHVSKGRATPLPGPHPPHMVPRSIRRELASKPIGLQGSSHITSSRPS